MIVLDTSILSAMFRRREPQEPESPPVAVLRQIILEDRALGVPGIVVQEMLSGIRSEGQFRELQAVMEGFPILVSSLPHHVSAARISNECGRRGITCTPVDCLIAAMAISVNGALFTTDKDFERMAPVCRLRLFAIEHL